MRTALLIGVGLLALMLLAACASQPAPAPGPGLPSLRAERQWLHQWFDATPVRLADRADGSLQLDVPLVHAFDAGGSTPRPALKAVLDKLAQSLQRQPTAQLQLGAPAPVARDRLAAMRAHLGSQGIGPARLPAMAAAQPDMVLLRLAPGPTARLGDAGRAAP